MLEPMQEIEVGKLKQPLIKSLGSHSSKVAVLLCCLRHNDPNNDDEYGNEQKKPNWLRFVNCSLLIETLLFAPDKY